MKGLMAYRFADFHRT